MKRDDTRPVGRDDDVAQAPGAETVAAAPLKRARKRKFIITGEVVPRGALKPNLNHPFAELPEGKTRREAFVDALGDALAELPKRHGGPLDS